MSNQHRPVREDCALNVTADCLEHMEAITDHDAKDPQHKSGGLWQLPSPHTTIEEIQLFEQRSKLREFFRSVDVIEANNGVVPECLNKEIVSTLNAISWYESNPPRPDPILGKKPKKMPRTTAPLPSFMAPVDQSSSVAQGGGASSFQSSGGDLACKPDHLSQLSQPFVEPISSGTLSSAAYGGGASSSTMTSVARGGGGASSVQSSSARGGGGVMVDITNQGTMTSGMNEEELTMSLSTSKVKLTKNGTVSRTGDNFRKPRGGGGGNNRVAILNGTLASHFYRQSLLEVGEDEDRIVHPIEDSPFAVLVVCRARVGVYWMVNEVNVNFLANQFHIAVQPWKDRQLQMESNLRDFQYDIAKITTKSEHKICIALAPVGVDYTDDGIARLIFNSSKRGSLVSLCRHGGCYVQLDADSQLTDPSRCDEHQLCIGCNVNPVNIVRFSLCGDCHTQQQSQRLCRMSHVDLCNNNGSATYGYTYCSKQCQKASSKLKWCTATDCNNIQDMSPDTVVPREKYDKKSYTQTSEYIDAGRIFTSCGRGVFCTSHWQDKTLRICKWCGINKTTKGWQCGACVKLKTAGKEKLFNARLPTIDE